MFAVQRAARQLRQPESSIADTTASPELAEELRLALLDATRLAEMIALLGSSLDVIQLQQLRAELQLAKRLAERLSDEAASCP